MTLKHFIGPSDPLLRSSFNEEMKTVVEGLRSVSDKYGISQTTKSGTNRLIKRLGKFKSLNEYDVVFFVQASEILGTNRQATIAVVSVNSTVIHAGSKTQRREALTEWEFIGIAQLHQDFGQVYMRPELLGDKINELFNPVEVDFDFDKEFSKKYFVVTTDETNLREYVTPSLLSAIKRHNDLEIEIQGRDLLVRQKKRVSTESAETISQFLFELTKKK